jgi:divalent metal cation (Fe/Co/Zn/Cd) transporter
MNRVGGFHIENFVSVIIGLIIVVTIFPVVLNSVSHQYNDLPIIVGNSTVNQTKHLGTSVLMQTEQFDNKSVGGNQTQIPLWKLSLIVIMIVCFVYVIVRNMKRLKKKIKW